jgi:hypothetical protein
MTFSDNGFLDPSVESCITQVNAAHKAIFDICFELNRFSNKLMMDLKVNPTDVTQLLMGCLYIRAVSGYQGTLILAKRGMLNEAGVVARALMETVFRMKAIERDKEIAKMYINEETLIRKKLINKYRAISKKAKAEVQPPGMHELYESLERTIEEEEIDELKTIWFAEKAGLIDDYHSAYSLLSHDVHVNIKSIDDYVVYDEHDNVTSLKVGPDDSTHELLILGLLSGKYIIIAGETCAKTFSLDVYPSFVRFSAELTTCTEYLKLYPSK